MASFHEYMTEYRRQVEKGYVQVAYKGLMEYIMGLRTYIKNKYPDYLVSNSMYYGYMDMTYFSIFPGYLKDRNLKIALVFIHETFRFEVWLAGKNKQVQSKYWTLFSESDWNKYHIVSSTKGVDSIIEHIIVADPDFSDLDALTSLIEWGTYKFIKDIESIISVLEN